jgi:hypothetical protein
MAGSMTSLVLKSFSVYADRTDRTDRRIARREPEPQADLWIGQSTAKSVALCFSGLLDRQQRICALGSICRR